MNSGAGPLISVIVPVYNVRPYIEEALESVAGQTYGSLEVILVDDGSTDGSGEVCDRYAARDARFRVIRQENRGLSAARNAGLDAMTGAYVAFLDPDDAFHPDMLRRLLEALRRENVPLAACGVARMGGRTRRSRSVADRALTREQALRALLEGEFTVAVWNKLYDRALWRQLRFPEGYVYEDVDTTFRILDGIEACCVVDDALVLHRVRPGSITQSPSPRSLEDWLRAHRHYTEYIRANTPAVFHPEQLSEMDRQEVRSMLGCYGKVISINADADTRRLWRQRVLDAAQQTDLSRCPPRVRVACGMVRRCPKLYALAYPVYHALRMASLRLRHR